MPIEVQPGQCFPLGASVRPDGVNFSVFSKNCTGVELLLFDRADDPRPARAYRLDPVSNHTFYYWHAFVPGLRSGQLYGYRVHGPYDLGKGHRFDGSKVLLDPYTRAVMYGSNYNRDAACRPGDNCAAALKSVVVDPSAYDWEGDIPLNRSLSGTTIYELHVGGFTRHPNSGVPPERRGTYAGLIDKIPYLQDLGVTAVELLPVQQFDDSALPPPRREYWGYNPIAFFAPHRGYCSQVRPLGPVDEFRDLVKALHRAGIEVILDMVFNHTAEGGAGGPTLCYRGLENRAYYIPADGRTGYANYSGCGNTINGNHSIVRRLIVDCLHYWVEAMHVDGFRFDLASVLARDEKGRPLEDPPILWEIESDPVLAGCKIIAEAWDAVGLYQVGTFVGHRWAEWNGQFRDEARRFVRGDTGTVPRLAGRLLGSPDLFPDADRDPHRSINFITCHDGFTLHDLVSYDHKHNEANGEGNRDGADENYSWNCGVEGPTQDPAILALRARQMKNLLALLMIAHGTPMLSMGDEVQRTQWGNNNAYCQDGPLAWFDWDAVDRHAPLLRFVRQLIWLRRQHLLFRTQLYWAVGEGGTGPQLTWHGVRLYRPDWADCSHTLAFELRWPDAFEHFYAILNGYHEALTFELPQLSSEQRWYRLVDTTLPSPVDAVQSGEGPTIAGSAYCATARSVILLEAR